MSRRLITIVVAVVLAATAGFLFLVRRPPAPPPTPAQATDAPSARPAPAASAGEAAAPAVSAGAPARRPRAPKAEAPAPSAAVTPAAPTMATLHIDSDVPGAQVFIDHTFVGAAPITAPDIAPGAHRLNVSATGYEGYADTIEVIPGPREIMVRFKEVALDARIAVVHKHAFGSCKGTLSARPQGLRYDTSNAGDAFTSPLTDLTTFEMNYLEKNLKIRLKNGKQFNFTDPDGNADRLFVFLRDVSKARDRIKKGD